MSVSETSLAVIVLAAGKGTRMKSDLHKVLHPIAGRAMLLHLIGSLETVGAERQVIIAGDRREQIVAALAGSSAEVVVQEPQLGTAHAALMAKDALADFAGLVLVCFGDVPFLSATTVKSLCRALDHAAVAVLGFRPVDSAAYGRIISDADGTVRKMVEYKDASAGERAVTLCNSGVIVARSDDMWRLLAKVDDNNAAKEFYLPDVATLAIAEGARVVAIETEEAEVMGINSRAELADAEARWQQRRRKAAMDDGATLIAPETVWFAWDTVLGRDVLIEPNVFFGPGVTVADAVTIRANSHFEGARLASGVEVGPFARLRPGTVLGEKVKIGNFVEVKKATFGVGAKANHLSYIGDAEVGAGANIGAGTITCNYDGYFKYKTVIGERAFIGSNSALVAPVKIGPDAIVAAGSAVTRDVAAGELRLVRGEQLVKPGWADRFHDAMKKKKADKPKS
ncbi:bifunctional UDP-N-acetylglucosamine diphosphorylase/glucosamine-1-phosphate N-acetyltransferase GlmU [Novosphingobium sp.]|uniref:bifunctional UDP-N-acetylglucosamine diphosphorylase/glucosamine-1-phosphate N-acetyltransferase GlmU n=1 Tax=Novosphingobium sp. TaxID=1874826 RepID=UPI0025E403EA|nr:bifunctional UDP-N-acetylglucosamine diphosphorylase/glucosamine-1-phosphate N-acetyltransferase GlmU [Novosphingobium sp.]